MTEKPKTPVGAAIDRVLQSYGDLLFDLCETLLASSEDAEEAFLKIVKRLERELQGETYKDFERPWIFGFAWEILNQNFTGEFRTLPAEDQIRADALTETSEKLKVFDLFFHRLLPKDRAVLLLHDKYGFPLSEVEMILQAKEGDLKVQRGQALRSLADWIWGTE